MGKVLHLPTPNAPLANNTDVTLAGCWVCGLLLFDDETTGLCTDCDHQLNRPPTPTPSSSRPIALYLKPFGPDGIAQLAQAIIETGIAQAEQHAADWATDHHLTGPERAAYVGCVRGRAELEYTSRCQHDAQQLGVQLGWTKAL